MILMQGVCVVSMQRFEIDLNSKQISFLRQFLGGAWIPSWAGCRCHISQWNQKKSPKHNPTVHVHLPIPLRLSSHTFRHSNLIYILNYSFWRHDISYSLVGIPENHERQTQFSTRIGQRTTYITISTLLTCPLPIISGAQGANCSFHPGSLYQIIREFAMTNMNNKSTCYKE